MTENEIARAVVSSAFSVHQALGPGLLESVYETALSYELAERGLRVARQVPIAVHYRGVQIDGGYRADLVVEERLLVEVKSVERTAAVHKKQTITYVRRGNFRLGLLLNFGAPLMKEGITRIVNGLDDGAG